MKIERLKSIKGSKISINILMDFSVPELPKDINPNEIFLGEEYLFVRNTSKQGFIWRYNQDNFKPCILEKRKEAEG